MKSPVSSLICFSFAAAIVLAAAGAGAQQTVAGGGAAPSTARPAPVPADGALSGAKYLDPKAPLEERVDDLFSRLTPLEKVSLVHGCSDMGYGNIPRIGLPEVLMTDGPQGVRLESGTATAFPCGLAMAATWNTALAEQAGKAMGEECRALNRRVFLAPGVNIMRTPLGGRNFEYMGEDPLLAGKTAAACIRGIQSQGVAACVKHWNFNEQEHWRTTINVECGERALREIYGPAFETAVREGKVWAVMPAYNRFEGDYCTASKFLNLEVLDHDYGFDGALISDWGAWHDDKLAIEGGCTLEMPSKQDAKRDADLASRVSKGEISSAALDAAVRRDLRLLFRVGAFDAWNGGSLNTTAHQRTSRQAATESIVLLKNTRGVLPLDIARCRKIAVIGPNADQHHTMADGSGLALRGGSGATRPPREITPLSALKERFGDKIVYAPGLLFEQKLSITDAAAQAVTAAKDADVVIFFAGTDHRYDREALGWGDVEGADKPDLEFIGAQADLIRKVAAVNPRTVVVMVNGAPVSVERWHKQVPAIVEAWYGGMEAGNAIADILIGAANPSGKLPCTFGKKLDDWLCHNLGAESFPGTGNFGVVKYLDDIWVGYRHFDRAGIAPRFPFGYGLSYTTFKYGKAELSAKTLTGDETLTVSAPVKNTGKRAGAEVAELYLHENEPALPRPPQELKGYAKVFLQPGETQTVSFTIHRRDLSFWDVATRAWKATPGKFEARIGASSRDIRAIAEFELK
jgi:beta-glucosidase